LEEAHELFAPDPPQARVHLRRGSRREAAQILGSPAFWMKSPRSGSQRSEMPWNPRRFSATATVGRRPQQPSAPSPGRDRRDWPLATARTRWVLKRRLLGRAIFWHSFAVDCSVWEGLLRAGSGTGGRKRDRSDFDKGAGSGTGPKEGKRDRSGIMVPRCHEQRGKPTQGGLGPSLRCCSATSCVPVYVPSPLTSG
jgi:hypothetical protein